MNRDIAKFFDDGYDSGWSQLRVNDTGELRKKEYSREEAILGELMVVYSKFCKNDSDVGLLYRCLINMPEDSTIKDAAKRVWEEIGDLIGVIW